MTCNVPTSIHNVGCTQIKVQMIQLLVVHIVPMECTMLLVNELDSRWEESEIGAREGGSEDLFILVLLHLLGCKWVVEFCVSTQLEKE